MFRSCKNVYELKYFLKGTFKSRARVSTSFIVCIKLLIYGMSFFNPNCYRELVPNSLLVFYKKDIMRLIDQSFQSYICAISNSILQFWKEEKKI